MSFSELWRNLQSRPATDEAEGTAELRIRLAKSSPGARAYAAWRVDDDALGVLIEFHSPALAAIRLPPPAKRIRVAVIASGSAGLPRGHEALLVELKDRAFVDLFDRLASDLAAGVAATATASAAATTMAGVLDRWFRFMDRAHPLLSDEEVKGLIGELCVLERLVLRLGSCPALDAWVSPGGSLRDFEAAGCTVEVKAFSPSQGATVRINDPYQLEPDPGVPLFLACQELGRSEIADYSLAGHAERVGSLFGSDTDAAERFGLLLAASGFPQGGGDPLYVRQGWRPGILHTFRVTGDFPRVKPLHIPAGACAVRFSLEVAALRPFSVDAESAIGPASENL